MKQITQDIFYDAPDWVKSARVTSTGLIWGYNLSLSELKEWAAQGRNIKELDYISIGFSAPAACWQNSAIDREVSK